MSETVLYIGTLKRVDLGVHTNPTEYAEDYLNKKGINKNDWESRIEQFIDKTYIDYDPIYYYHEKLDVLYHIEYENKGEYNDIIIATKNEDKSIKFILKYYNGGAGFDECMEEAVSKIEDKL